MFERFIRMFCSVLDALSLDPETIERIIEEIQNDAGRENGGEDDEKVDD